MMNSSVWFFFITLLCQLGLPDSSSLEIEANPEAATPEIATPEIETSVSIPDASQDHIYIYNYPAWANVFFRLDLSEFSKLEPIHQILYHPITYTLREIADKAGLNICSGELYGALDWIPSNISFLDNPFIIHWDMSYNRELLARYYHRSRTSGIITDTFANTPIYKLGLDATFRIILFESRLSFASETLFFERAETELVDLVPHNTQEVHPSPILFESANLSDDMGKFERRDIRLNQEMFRFVRILSQNTVLFCALPWNSELLYQLNERLAWLGFDAQPKIFSFGYIRDVGIGLSQQGEAWILTLYWQTHYEHEGAYLKIGLENIQKNAAEIRDSLSEIGGDDIQRKAYFLDIIVQGDIQLSTEYKLVYSSYSMSKLEMEQFFRNLLSSYW